MNIRLGDLLGAVPEEMVVSVQSADLGGALGECVFVSGDTPQGTVVLPVTREGLARVLKGERVPRKAADPHSAKGVERAKARKAAAATTTRRKRQLVRGQTRRVNGKTQTLVGFTDSGSVQEKPAGVQRRVRGPSGSMVWPIWREIGD